VLAVNRLTLDPPLRPCRTTDADVVCALARWRDTPKMADLGASSSVCGAGTFPTLARVGMAHGRLILARPLASRARRVQPLRVGVATGEVLSVTDALRREVILGRATAMDSFRVGRARLRQPRRVPTPTRPPSAGSPCTPRYSTSAIGPDSRRLRACAGVRLWIASRSH